MKKDNNLAPEMLSLHAINSFAPYDSSPRSVMFSSHISQRLVIEGADEKRIQTGIEHELANYTFDIRMPEDGKIIKVIDRYPKGADAESLSFNPETIVIYEKESNKELNYFSIPKFGSYHQFFGFKYHLRDEVSLIKPGAYIAKDTVFASSSSVSENNGFQYGINANVAFMTVPSISEDGVMVSKDFLKKLKFKVYETRIIEFGSNNFPLNLYGSKHHYKPFPDIGEEIREDGILMALRSYNDNFAPVEMSAYDTMEVDFIFDKLLYARGKSGKVIDIKVISNNVTNRKMPDIFCQQLNKYKKALIRYYNELSNTEKTLRLERKKKYGSTNMSINPKLHRLLVESLNVLNFNDNDYRQNLNLLYRKTPIDEFRIEFVLEYTIEPNIGYKLTDIHGGKQKSFLTLLN